MKKIKGHVPTSSIKTVYKKEFIDRYLSIFGKYFELCGNCITNQNLDGITNAIFCFTKVRPLSPIRECSFCGGGHLSIPDKWGFGNEDVVWEHFSLNSYIPKYMNVEVHEFQKRLCPNSVVISILDKKRDRVIAEYCPNKNILLTTDWTHNDSKISFVNEVLEHLESLGVIKRRVLEKKKPTIMLGADPEFELIDPKSKRVIDCSEDGPGDRVLMSSGIGRIGRDGAGHQREIRPEPSDTPEGLISNIEKLINEAYDESWSLKGNTFPLGGHIHVGGVEVSWDFVELLDYLLFPLTELNGDARKNSRYSKIDGNTDRMREQPHGLEYRAPPSGWLSSKELARVTLKIVKLAAEKHYCGDDVEITDNLQEDLKTLGLTSDEVSAFFSEISKFRSEGLPEDLKKAWGCKEIRRLFVEFRNGWSFEVRNFIESALNTLAKEEDLDGKIILYGTDRENSLVVNPSYSRRVNLPGPYMFYSASHKYKIGFSFDIRMKISEIMKIQPSLNNIILAMFKERDKKKVEVVEEVPLGINPLGSYYIDTTSTYNWATIHRER